MEPAAAPTLGEPPSRPASRRLRSKPGIAGLVFLAFMFLACLGSAFWTLQRVKPAGVGPDQQGTPRYAWQEREARQLPPTWLPWGWDEETTQRYRLTAIDRARAAEARARGVTAEVLEASGWKPSDEQISAARPTYVMGTDVLGRDVFVRSLAGGTISLTIGLLAAAIAVTIGTLYGAVAGYVGGRVDAVMMRTVDILYGLPYVLLVVLLAVAADAVMDEHVSRSGARASFVERAEMESLQEQGKPGTPGDARAALEADPGIRAELQKRAVAALPEREVSDSTRVAYNLVTLLVAIGGVSWLTMARVIRGQVLTLKSQPFVEAARAVGAPTSRIFLRHLLPNLVGPIVVYAALTVPQAILQESFLSFLGIGVKPPAPSWGNLAADGVAEVNPHVLADSRWWLLVFPCVLLGCTLLALNFLGEGLREAVDPKRTKR
jgi:ABC-type dipeptide/oligopeptide/nickel transport system permease subunit